MVQFGQYLEGQGRKEWANQYVDYRGLKDLIKEASSEVEPQHVSYSPRTTSLSIVRANKQSDQAEERFFQKLELEVEKVNKFTLQLVTAHRQKLKELFDKSNKATSDADRDVLLAEAKAIGEEYLALEKYVNINYMAFHKILKKHDKNMPAVPCRQFYIAHLHQQAWVQGTYSDLLVQLSMIYSKLRGDTSGQKNEDSSQGFVRSTTKYWVRNEDVSAVKHHVLQHLPVFQFDGSMDQGDSQLVNSVYFDNESLELYHGRLDKKPGAIAFRIRWYGNGNPKLCFMERKTHRESWKGEESVKERFVLKEDKVVPFLTGNYTLEDAVTELQARGKSPAEVESFSDLFTDIWAQVDAKQLHPFIRTQYMRTAFQIPFDSTVRVSLDTNLCMIKENPDVGPSCKDLARWYRDPSIPVNRTDITRFPHAVLEVKLSLQEGQPVPSWVQEMIDSGYLTEVHKFSKFIHGTCTLYPEMVQAVPYWVDDESVRASMLMSAPVASSASQNGAPTLISVDEGGEKPRKRMRDLDEMRHPLLGDAPTLKLIEDKEKQGFAPRLHTLLQRKVQAPGFWKKLFGYGEPPKTTVNLAGIAQKLEPKTFFANERTFLSWLHMSVTIGSIAAALLGFAGTDDPATAGAPVSRNLVAIVSLILLPVAISMVGYAISIFIWRAQLIAKKRSGHFDDPVGPLVLCGVVATALIAILIISIIDWIEVDQLA